MARSAAERGKIFREKKKEDAEFRQKEKIRFQKIRLKVKSNKVKLRKVKEQNKIRSRVYRIKQKELKINLMKEEEPPSASCYSNRSTKMKAVKRVSRNLPLSPRKKVEIVRHLAESFGVVPLHESRRIGNSLPLDIKEAAINFYLRDDNSHISPGMKDVVICRNDDGTKEKKQKRYLSYSLKELFSCFKEENPAMGIKLSKFANLRPQHVLLSRDIPENVCLCKIHENAISLINSISNKLPVVGKYNKSWIANHIILTGHENCNTEACAECLECTRLSSLVDTEENQPEEITYDKWMTVDSKLSKFKVSVTFEIAFAELISILPQFIHHVHTKRIQSMAYEEDKKHSSSSSIVIQTDFAENFNCINQDEIQSAYWGHRQVSLFTCCIWTGEDKPKSIIIVSDDLNHSKEAIAVFFITILKKIQDNIDSLSFWSDGPASQYKNRFMFAFLPHLQKKFNIQRIKYNFFATGHGKGPVDGLGGSTKRMVAESIKRRSHVVQNADQFYNVCKDRKLSIEIIVVNNIQELVDKYGLITIFNEAAHVDGINKTHFWDFNGGASSLFARSPNPVIHSYSEQSINLPNVPDSKPHNQEDLQPVALLREAKNHVTRSGRMIIPTVKFF